MSRPDFDRLNRYMRSYAEHTNPEGSGIARPGDRWDGRRHRPLGGRSHLPGLALAHGVGPDRLRARQPDPEVLPEIAARHVRVVATGRSDYPNQINNVLCFPGILRGALDSRATQITERMKLAAARGIAATVREEDLRVDFVVPSVFNRSVVPEVARAAEVEWARERAGGLEGQR